MDQKVTEIKTRFTALALENRFPHAILLEGGNNRDLMDLAKQIALTAVCEDATKKPCTKCSHCKKAKDNNHPDVIIVEEKDKKRKTISVDLMRWVRDDAIIKPNEAAKKVYLIPKADTMTREAQNALLKLLEEPPAYAVFLLLCNSATAMLATIRSRTQIFSLEELPVLTGNTTELAETIALAIAANTEAELLFATAPLIKAKDREKFSDVLRGLELIFRDCCVSRAGGSTILSSANRCVETLCRKLSHKQLLQILEEIQEIHSLNERNLNLALLVTCFCAHLRQLTAG